MLFSGAQQAQIYLDTARECYEAFVIYNFFMYLLAYLEEVGPSSKYLLSPKAHHKAGVCLGNPVHASSAIN